MKIKLGFPLVACLLLSAACLAGGYASAGIWPGVLLAIGWAAGWVAARRLRVPWLPPALLAANLIAAAGGVLLGISGHWMIPAAAFALATWELAVQSPGKPLPGIGEESLRRRAEQLLVVSVGLGLLAAELLLLVRLDIPFGVLLLAALLAFACLFGFFQFQKSRRDLH